MSHDQKSCDIYRKFKWHKQASITPEPQPHYTMRPLSIEKLNIVISRLNSGQTTCQISSTFGVSSGTISKKSSLAFLSPLVVILSTSPQPISVIQPLLLPQGRLKQQYKYPKHSKLSPTNPSLPRKCADTSAQLV